MELKTRINPYRRRFHKRTTLIAVIHAESMGQVSKNVDIALVNGMDGVLLINHAVSSLKLMQYAEEIHHTHTGCWLGINDLLRNPAEVLRELPDYVDGLWSDNAGVRESGLDEVATAFRVIREARQWNGIYFGGVAMKGQEPIRDPARAAKIATEFVDVVTTSGKATGFAPPVTKIESMRRAIGSHPLAIASGIDAENIRSFIGTKKQPLADCFFVASSISISFTELDKVKVRELVYEARPL